MKNLLILLLLSSTGCATVGVTQLKTDVTSKEPDCKLDIYTSEKEVERPFEAVCLLDAKTGTSAFDDKTVAGAIDITRPKACECGADALVVMTGSQEGDGFWIPKTGNAMLKAIRYKVAH